MKKMKVMKKKPWVMILIQNNILSYILSTVYYHIFYIIFYILCMNDCCSSVPVLLILVWLQDTRYEIDL